MCSWWQKIIGTCSSNITTTTVTCPQLSTITQKINTCTQNGFPAPSYTKNNTTTITASCPELPNITQNINTCTQNGFPAPNYTKNNTPQTRTTIDINVYNA